MVLKLFSSADGVNSKGNSTIYLLNIFAKKKVIVELPNNGWSLSELESLVHGWCKIGFECYCCSCINLSLECASIREIFSGETKIEVMVTTIIDTWRKQFCGWRSAKNSETCKQNVLTNRMANWCMNRWCLVKTDRVVFNVVMLNWSGEILHISWASCWSAG